jgi:hypothetical protein
LFVFGVVVTAMPATFLALAYIGFKIRVVWLWIVAHGAAINAAHILHLQPVAVLSVSHV